MMNERIEFHNVPSFYLAYMDNWLAHKKKEKANPADIAVVEDIRNLVKVAVSVLEPVPAEPAIKKQKDNGKQNCS